MAITVRSDPQTPSIGASPVAPDLAEQVCALQAENAELRALLALQRGVGRSASPRDALQATIEQVRAALEANRAYALLWEWEHQRFVPGAAAGLDDATVRALKAADLSPGAVVAIARALESDHPVHIEAASAGVHAALGLGELLLAPVRDTMGEPLGLLVFDFDRAPGAAAVTPGRLHLAGAVAAQVALMLERAQLDEQLGRRTSRLEALNEIGSGLAAHATGEPASLFRYLYPRLAAIVDGAGYYLAVRDERRAAMTVWSAVKGRLMPPRAALPLGADALSAAVRSGKPASFDTAAALPALPAPLAADLPTPASAIYVPLRLRRRTLGTLAVVSARPHAFTERHVEFLSTVAAQTAVTLDHSRLYNLLHTRGEVRRRLLDQTLQAQEAERKSVVDGILDGVLQELASYTYRLDLCMRLSELGQHERSREELRQTRQQLAERIESLRETVAALRPSSLDHLGLQSVLRDELTAFGARLGIRTEFRARFKERLPAPIETRAYRIAQELLNNIDRHAGASLVWIELHTQGNEAILSVSDNGQGFDADEALSSQQGMGLHAIREQAELVGGTVRVQSRRGAGTRVEVAFPRGTTGRRETGT